MLSKIYGFNWNKTNSVFLTVEETIMTHLTNDFAEFASPHVAHIVFTEFKKFMYLNKFFFESEKKNISGDKQRFTGLLAPPMIDAVWQILMSINTQDINSIGNKPQIYTLFWSEIFGTYLERPDALSNERKYATTLELLKSTADLNPFWNIWCDYSSDELELDNHSTCWVIRNELGALISKHIDNEMQHGELEFTFEKISDLASKTIEFYQTEQHSDIRIPQIFSTDIKTKPWCNKNKKIGLKKLYEKVEERISIDKPKLIESISQKYMLNDETAEAWVIEFVKYVTILITETDMDVTDMSIPCSAVEWVHDTYAQFGTNFHKFSGELFNKVVYSESFTYKMWDLQKQNERYASTLEKYEAFYGEAPAESLWEPKDKRFWEVDYEKYDEETKTKDVLFENTGFRVIINLNRLIISKLLLKISGNSFNSTGIDITKSSCEATKKIHREMEKVKKSGLPYMWRQHFPHWDNIYFKDIRGNMGNIIIPNSYRGMIPIIQVFKPGGVLFINNPYDESLSTSKNVSNCMAENFYDNVKLEKMKDVNTDHLADGAIVNQEKYYGNLVGGRTLKNGTQ